MVMLFYVVSQTQCWDVDKRAENSTAQLVSRARKSEQITSVLELPDLALNHILFTLKDSGLCIQYKALYGTPKYLELLVACRPKKSRRSESEVLLTVPQTRDVAYNEVYCNILMKCNILDTFREKMKTN